MNISVIIPTYNEAANIGDVVNYIKKHAGALLADVIVTDGGSVDNTLDVANEAGALAVLSPKKGRAAQMNHAASLAKGDVFYFVHADCYPPATFTQDIQKAVSEGYHLGRYRTRFDSNKFILKINAWFTRFDLFICMGGDQTLFAERTLFKRCKGFNEDMKIMEEYDFCKRAREMSKYKILNGEALISARKYETNSWLRVQLANSKIVSMYKKGATQQAMIDAYGQMLNYRKNAF